MKIYDYSLFTSWDVDKQTKQAIYQQLAMYIKGKINNGSFAKGYKFPPFRNLGEFLGISKGTVALCFELLAAEGYVKQLHSRRYTVAFDGCNDVNDRVDWQHFITRASHTVTKSREIRNSHLADIHNLNPEYFYIDGDEFDSRKLYSNAVERVANNISKPGNWQLLYNSDLMDQLVIFLQKRNITVKPSQILLTHNEHVNAFITSSGLLSHATTLIKTKMDKFTGIIALEVTNTHVSYVKTDDEGIIIADLYSKIKSAYNPILYIEPNCAYPLGQSMSDTRKYEIFDLCMRMKVPIIESDMQRDYSLKEFFPLKSLDTTGSIIYTTSLGTMLSYHDSIGLIIANEHVISYLKNNYIASIAQPPNIITSLYLELLKSGDYAQYIEALKPKLHKRYVETDNIFKHYLSPYATWQMPEGGVFFLVTFKRGLHFGKMNMIRNRCHWKYYSKEELIEIAVTSCSLPELEEFIAHLAKECEKQLK